MNRSTIGSSLKHLNKTCKYRNFTTTQVNRQVKKPPGGRLYNFIRSTLGFDPPPSDDVPTFENRFHPWDSSPSQDLRTRAAFIRARAKCPITGKDIQFVCPKSGIPTHHDEQAWLDDKYHQQEGWKLLKEANCYEHDLRSGREFPEFDFPMTQDRDAVVNFLNWDTYFYTRQFYSMDTEFNLAATTKMLSYPVTMGSVMHQYSPYSLKPNGPLTLEGLKSLAALRYTIHPQDKTSKWQERPMRFFILGARAESQLPPHVWKQLGFLLPDSTFELVFIGPESNYDRVKRHYVTNQSKLIKRFDQQMSMTFYTEYFHVLNEQKDFMPYDPYLDCFFLFHPGLGAPEAMDQWEKTIPGLLESKCPIFVTGFHESDSKRDWNWLHEKFGDELDVLLEPVNNRFGSTKWEVNDLNPSETYQFNQQLFGFRGKRYHAVKY